MEKLVSLSMQKMTNLRSHFVTSSLLLFTSLIVLVALTGCADNKTEQKQEVTVKEEVEQSVSREAVYVYEEQQANEKQISLRLGSEPKLIKQSYVRLAGVVSGDRAQALVEDAGKGICLSVGESFKGYVVQSISNDQIVIRLERK